MILNKRHNKTSRPELQGVVHEVNTAAVFLEVVEAEQHVHSVVLEDLDCALYLFSGHGQLAAVDPADDGGLAHPHCDSRVAGIHVLQEAAPLHEFLAHHRVLRPRIYERLEILAVDRHRHVEHRIPHKSLRHVLLGVHQLLVHPLQLDPLLDLLLGFYVEGVGVQHLDFPQLFLFLLHHVVLPL